MKNWKEGEYKRHEWRATLLGKLIIGESITGTMEVNVVSGRRGWWTSKASYSNLMEPTPTFVSCTERPVAQEKL